MNDEMIRLNTVIEPPVHISQAVIKMSEVLADFFEPEFVLDGETTFPHITLYSPEYPQKNIEKIQHVLKETAKNLTPFDLPVKGVKQSWGYLMVEFVCTEEVKNLHIEIAEKLNPLREGHIQEQYQSDKYYGKHRDYIEKYGYPRVMDMYTPHLTIIRLKNEEDAKKAQEEIQLPFDSMTVSTLGLYEMGEHGTCTTQLKLVDFGG